MSAALTLSGCAPSAALVRADIAAAIERVDLAWQLDNQRQEAAYRVRVFEAGQAVAFDATRKAMLAIGVSLQQYSAAEGIVVGAATAPTPLTEDEWREIVEAERPRLSKISGPYLSLQSDPKDYRITMKATLRDLGDGRVLLVVDYGLSSLKLASMGIASTKHAPPDAVRIGAGKLWAAIAKELQSTPGARIRPQRVGEET